MRRTALALIATLPMIALPVAATAASAQPAGAAAATTASKVSSFSIHLKEQNASGATGEALLSLEGDRLTVNLTARGLTPNAPHVAHVHGAPDSNGFRCGTADDDVNGDGIVSTTEGAPHTGAAGISLTTRGDTSSTSGLAVERFPTADAAGNLTYQRTFSVPQNYIANFRQLLVIQHGVDINKNGTYDFDKGPSDLLPSLPAEATAPATCGTIETAAIGLIPRGGVETGSDGPARRRDLPLLGLVGATLLAAGAALTLAVRRASGTR
jgi:Cu/Zn superoxide dismutase